MPPSGKSHLLKRWASHSRPDCVCVCVFVCVHACSYMHMLRCKDAELLMLWGLGGQSERTQKQSKGEREGKREKERESGHCKDRQAAIATFCLHALLISSAEGSMLSASAISTAAD